MKCLIACVFLSTLAFGQAPPEDTPPKAICPLSESQTQNSIEAWAKIAATIASENRCLGCHGRVNPFIDGTGPDPGNKEAPPSEFEHGPGKVDKKADCNECHSKMPLRTSDGKPSRWTTAPDFLAFVGKDPPTLCKQVRSMLHSAKFFLGHLKDDNGGHNFAGAAFNGDRGLDRVMFPETEVPTEKPHISHSAFLKLGHDWIDAMGGEMRGNEDCGCKPLHYAIRLSAVTTVVLEDVDYESTMGQVDIPITFADDGTFTGEATAEFEGGGAVTDCTAQGQGTRTMKVSGKAVETAHKQSMHLEVKTGSPLEVSGSFHCPERSGGVQKSVQSSDTLAVDIKGDVGEAKDVLMPSPGPELKSTSHIEIVQREEEQE